MLLQGKKDIRAQHLDKKKYSFTGNIKEKKFLRLENPPPPQNFSNGPSLNIIRIEFLHKEGQIAVKNRKRGTQRLFSAKYLFEGANIA